MSPMGLMGPIRPYRSSPSNGAHVLLHFEAVDYITVVMVNGKVVGEHQGGYDPFTFDITNALLGSGTQDLIVKVIDTTGQGNYPYQPRGKQSLTPGGIFYTGSSGIWQTVWLETVPANYIIALLDPGRLEPRRRNPAADIICWRLA